MYLPAVPASSLERYHLIFGGLVSQLFSTHPRISTNAQPPIPLFENLQSPSIGSPPAKGVPRLLCSFFPLIMCPRDLLQFLFSSIIVPWFLDFIQRLLSCRGARNRACAHRSFGVPSEVGLSNGLVLNGLGKAWGRLWGTLEEVEGWVGESWRMGLGGSVSCS